ncbi:MAG: hypothetical protein EOO88_01275 [Pedobacter sp.]|nr:MAG: hypothetical protein EOO88_01275 [Pedobacter sp.]
MKRLVYLLSILVLSLVIIYLVYGQHSKYYISDPVLRNNLISLLFVLFPFALVGTLAGTLRACDSSKRRLIKIFVTISSAVFSAIAVLSVAFVSEHQYWIDDEILYVHKSHPQWKIVSQHESVAGYDGVDRRVVEVKQVNSLFTMIDEIDPSLINHAAWVRTGQ